MEHKVYLSRRNIQTLLNKLDRMKSGDFSACTLTKCDNLHAKYPQTMEACRVTAVETYDDLYKNGNKFTSDQIFLTREELIKLLTGTEMVIQLADEKGLTDDTLTVYSLEDAEYYDTREPGMVHPADDPRNKR